MITRFRNHGIGEEINMIRLEFLRRAKGLTQQALAEQIHYSGSMICRLERHRPKPTTVGKRLRAALEGYFGLSFDALMADVEPTTGPVKGQEAG